MFGSPSYLLQWSRTLCQRFFHRFGLHCATHQIRIILVSSVVITSLFYPALAIYSSSQPKSLSILDTFTSRNNNPVFDTQKDLVNLWSSHNTLRLHDDAVSRAKCGAGTALRVERVLIQSSHAEDDGAVNHQTLLSTLQFESSLEHLVSIGDTPCLKGPNGKCLVLSPLLFWNHDKETLATDTNILDTLSASQNVSVGTIFVTPEMVLAGRGSNEPHVAGSRFDFARFLALTYFFPGSDCLGNSEHASFLHSVRRVLAQNAKPVVQVQEPTLIALEYDPSLSKGERWSALSAFMYLPYLGFIVYVAWSVRKMNAVHSRLGVTFTALVEIAVSTVTSLSVCALVGFKVTLVPWELLPIVIVFVGAENMFNLVDAVGKTSVTLSVKQRIAEGLSRAGTSNTLKVVSYNAILGVIAVFSVGAVQQFCIFAIVVLVAHWFLAHTFFMAVLSIDVQRLELTELLRHDTSLTPPIRLPLRDSSSKQPQSPWQKLVMAVQNLLKGRAATNISLLMLLAITATLYYTTYSASTFSYDQFPNVSQLGAVPRLRTSATDAGLNKMSTAWNMWKIINPAQTPLLHLRIEEPIIVTFSPNTDQSVPTKLHKLSRPLFSTETFRLILWLLKIMVLPIAATTTLLWGLLLYLLKNAELLETRNPGLDPSQPQEDKQTLENQIFFSTLPRAFSSDVELIAASKDGKVVLSAGLHNEIIIWRVDTRSHVTIDAADVLLRTASTSSALSTLTCVAVDDRGCYCAVGTGAGVIAVWALEGDRVRPLPILSLDFLSTRVTDLRFCLPGGQGLLATYGNSVAAKWSVEDVPTATYIKPSSRGSVVRCSLVCVDSVERYLIAFGLDDGTLELIDAQPDAPVTHPFIQSDYYVQAGHPSDIPSKVHACRAELGGSPQLIIAVATDGGRISLWDGLTSECISILDEAYGRITSLRVSPVECETCHFCGQLPLESLSVAFSVDHVVRFFKLYLNDQTRRCACSRNTLHHASSRDNIGRRSRSNSTSSQLGPTSPSLARARPARLSDASAFPVSGHGVHSRRASEKDTGRRSLETLTVPVLGEEHESNNPSPTLDASGSRTLAHFPASFWRDAVVVRVTDITCERGGWGVSGTKAVGVRRKPRTQISRSAATPIQIKPSCSQGLTAATLERWEMWTFDPAASRLQSSLLADLTKNARKSDSPLTSSSRSKSADPIPRLPFTRVSPFLIASTHGLAGFGNTVGVFSFPVQ